MPSEKEDFLTSVLPFGKWQWFLIFLCSLPGVSLLHQLLGMVFIGATPDHWCRIQELKDARWSTNRIKETAIPWNDQNGDIVYSKCEMFDYEYNNLIIQGEKYFDNNGKTNTTISCTEWDYDQYSPYFKTIITEWDLVCSRGHLFSSMHSILFVGVLFGSLVTGPLSDNYGRRTIIAWTSVMCCIVGTLSAFSVNYLMLVVLRFAMGLSVIGLFISSYVLAMEMTPNNMRTRVAFTLDLATAIGRSSMAIIAYLIPQWNYLLLAFTVPFFFFASYRFLLPESPRWLLLAGREKEASETIVAISKRNGVHLVADDVQKLAEKLKLIQLEEGIIEKPSTSQKIKNAVLVYFRTPVMRSRSLKIFFAWFSVGFAATGTSLNFSNLPVNLYLTHIINGCIIFGTRSFMIAVPLTDIFGRKKCFVGCFMLAGLAGVSLLVVPDEYKIFNSALSILCNVFLANSFTLVYMVSAEMFPTEVRNGAIAFGSVIARIGGIMAPFVAFSLGSIHYVIPGAIFGVSAILAGTVCHFLPETKNRKLPETIEEVENDVD